MLGACKERRKRGGEVGGVRDEGVGVWFGGHFEVVGCRGRESYYAVDAGEIVSVREAALPS